MRVLDLFSGLGGFSEVFRYENLVTVDNDARFHPTILANVQDLRFPGLPPIDRPFDLVLASPPCQAFSVAALQHHHKDHIPDQHVSEALGLVATTLRLIAEVRPRWWVLENPRGMLRTYLGKPKETVFLCAYGSPWMKPTDLWGRYPGHLARPCAPHESAPRGSNNNGVQGVRDPALRAKLPIGLGAELLRRMRDTGQTSNAGPRTPSRIDERQAPRAKLPGTP